MWVNKWSYGFSWTCECGNYVSARIRNLEDYSDAPGCCNACVYNGIDRKNNRLGYFSANVVSCCVVCNKAKRTMPYEEFVAYLIKAGGFQTKKGVAA
jgi:hypothetical protein